MKITSLLSLAIIIASIISCGEDNMDTEITNPATYAFMRDGISTVSFGGQSTRIAMADELINGVRDFDIEKSRMLEMYSNEATGGGDANPFDNAELNVSTKSVKSKVAASQDFFSANTVEATKIRNQFSIWIEAQVDEVFPNEMELAAEGKPGQIADGASVRYVNGGGLEYDQAINKGLIGALMVDQMLNNYLSPAVLDEASNRADNDTKTTVDGEVYTNMEHKWDEAYGYLFGASSNSEDPRATLGQDAFLDKYLNRVENDEDFTGIADKIFQAFKLGRAAIVAGDYDVRDEQADIIKEEISKIIGIRSVYYLQQGKAGIENNNFGPAFHDLSEGYGFIYSLRFTRKSGSNDPYFTAAEVDAMIVTLEQNNGFWNITPSTLDDMSNQIANEFDFTVAQAAE